MNAQLKTELSPLRNGRITGSRIGAVLGVNPYSSRADVLREMVREFFGAPREFEGNEATAYGQDHEPDAIAGYESQMGTLTYSGGVLFLHPAHDFLAVTPDGLVEKGGLIECKCPYRGHYTHWNERPYYESQMRLQMECTGRQWCDFVVWYPDALHVSRIHHDAAWLPSVLPVLEAFMADFYAAIKTSASAAPFLTEKVRDDAEWMQAASDYRRAITEQNKAESLVKQARELLLGLANGQGVKGGGVQVIRSERAGTVAYAKAIKDLLPDADLSAYAGAPSVVFTIRECKE